IFLEEDGIRDFHVTGVQTCALPILERFVEKPDLQTAQEYVDSGQYFWNSGMFMFRADRFLEELAALEPDMLAACRAASERASREIGRASWREKMLSTGC